MADLEADEFPAEKKSLHAQERDTEENRKRRAEFLEKIRTTLPERLIYLDKSGVTTSMTWLYVRSRDGARIQEAAPGGHWKILTILGAMSSRGMIATMTIEEPTDTDIFLAYLDHVLCPKLRPGDVVVMDNLSAHKAQGVRERIAAAAAELLYLPPYSPDLNPIEKACPNSNCCSVPPSLAPKKRSTKPSPYCCRNSHQKMPKYGSEPASALYNNCEIALTTKIHLLADELGIPVDFLVTGGQVNYCTQAIDLLGERKPE